LNQTSWIGTEMWEVLKKEKMLYVLENPILFLFFMRILIMKLGLNINVILIMISNCMCDVSQYDTWTSNTTWEYGCPFNNYVSQGVVLCD